MLNVDDPHVIAHIASGNPGPSLLILGGIHGNEPAGVHALEDVCARITSENLLLQGSMLALKGNLPALKKNVRYIESDLNRMWSKELIQNISSHPKWNNHTEAKQLKILLSLIDSFFTKAEGIRIFIDLHTTSATGGPFSIISNDPFNTHLASSLLAPVILNFTSSLHHTTNIFMDENELKGFAFEAGQHTDPNSIAIHEAAIWRILHENRMLTSGYSTNRYLRKLCSASNDLPPFAQAVYRHPLEHPSDFHMVEGFHNFHPLQSGEVVAYENQQPVKVPVDGFMLMPLYQKQGEDGFFIVEAIDYPY